MTIHLKFAEKVKKKKKTLAVYSTTILQSQSSKISKNNIYFEKIWLVKISIIILK